ncbi:MAG TPA: cupin domain-containing protein [Polyangiaceae bacterium]|nr:cupin domain-containing protein [Polyangiaceae bacterium]
MKNFWASAIVMCGFAGSIACSSTDDPSQPKELAAATAFDLDDVKTNPTTYDFKDFKPNVQKLILAGAPETEHIAILWYTVADGGVGLHYHAKTESVYVIDGSQTDAKGTYPTGTVYFNPPGSGHQITDSSGFFVLAYAAPPDFASTDLIGEYEPVRIDTTDPDLSQSYPFEERQPGTKTFAAPLDGEGGLSAEFVDTSSADAYSYVGNYLLVLKGTCEIEGLPFGRGQLIVTKTVEPQAFAVTAAKGGSCLAMGVSFQSPVD